MVALEEATTGTSVEHEIASMEQAWFSYAQGPVLLNRSIDDERRSFSKALDRLTLEEWREAEAWWERVLRKIPTSELAAEIEYQSRCLCEVFLERTAGNPDYLLVKYQDLVRMRSLAVLAEYQRRCRLEATRVHWAPQRITSEFAAEVKYRIMLWEFIEDRFRIGLIREGNHYKACCPFHGEKTPSFKVWDDHYKCFGCGVFGDIYQYLEETNTTTSFTQAVEYAAAYAGMALPEPQPYVPKDAARKPHHTLVSAGNGSFAAPARYETIPLLEQYR